MSLTFNDAVYISWVVYLAFAVFYTILYIRWAIRCKTWYKKMLGSVPKTAARTSKTVKRAANLMNYIYSAMIVLFAVSLIANIAIVDMTYLFYVMGAIAYPWVIIGICRIVMSIHANSLEINSHDLTPRRLGLTASFRSDAYNTGVFKSE